MSVIDFVTGVTLDRDEVYAIGGNQEDLLPDVNSWLAIEVTTILSPSHFYVILPMGCKSLDTAHSDKGHEKSESEIYCIKCF